MTNLYEMGDSKSQNVSGNDDGYKQALSNLKLRNNPILEALLHITLLTK